MVKAILAFFNALMGYEAADSYISGRNSAHTMSHMSSSSLSGDGVVIALVAMIIIAVAVLFAIVVSTLKPEPEYEGMRDIRKEIDNEPDYYFESDRQSQAKGYGYSSRKLAITNVRNGEKKEFFVPDIIKVGRSAICDFVIPDMCVSSMHFMINMRGDRAFASDCNSTNGTVINGRYIHDETEIYHGSVISAGQTQLLIDM